MPNLVAPTQAAMGTRQHPASSDDVLASLSANASQQLGDAILWLCTLVACVPLLLLLLHTVGTTTARTTDGAKQPTTQELAEVTLDPPDLRVQAFFLFSPLPAPPSQIARPHPDTPPDPPTAIGLTPTANKALRRSPRAPQTTKRPENMVPPKPSGVRPRALPCAALMCSVLFFLPGVSAQTCTNANGLGFDSCMDWASSGECQYNPGYMLSYCMLSCGVCAEFDPEFDSCSRPTGVWAGFDQVT